MALKVGHVFVDIDAKTKSFTAKMNLASKRVNRFKDNALRMGKILKKLALPALAAGTALAVGALKAAKAAGVQEKAENDLAAALRSFGDNVDTLMPKYTALASAIQQQTVYGDEAVLSMMAQIRNLGVMPDQMEKATKGAIGLAKALNLDANSAARYTALALKGEVTILQDMSQPYAQLQQQQKNKRLLQI